MEDQKNLQSKSEAFDSEVQIIESVDDNSLAEIKSLIDSSVPEQMRYSDQDLKDIFETKGSIHIIIRGDNNKIIGFLCAIPKDSEYELLSKYDTGFTLDTSSLYVEAVVVNRGDLKTVRGIMKALLDKARELQYSTISMHARVSNDLSNVLQKRYGATFFRRIDNWMNFGEAFDYLELKCN